jgi:hypothetical protein
LLGTVEVPTLSQPLGGGPVVGVGAGVQLVQVPVTAELA